MTTLTINVDTTIEREFRKKAKRRYQGRKGFLGKATSEAMYNWLHQIHQKEIVQRQLELLNQGFDFGTKTANTREELHER